MKRLNRALTDANEKLARMAMVDELTGLLNLRAMRDRIKEIWSTTRRQAQPLSCIMIDIDHFKRINDTHGHGAGDAVLRQTAEMLKQTARTGDPLCRVGGEEFLVICPQTGGANACVAAERFRVAMETHPFDIGDQTLHLTLSAGVAEAGTEMTSATEMIRQADKALYRAKNAGRNRVERTETIVFPTEPLD
jgi:diguanylate cyclase (GGDEF)-like protein